MNSKQSHTTTIGIDCRLWAETGVGRYIRNLVRHLQKDERNSYVIFVLSKDVKQISSVVTNKNWKIVIADIPWHTITEQLLFPKILNKENLDLVHFPYFSVPFFYNKPFVMTIHDLILHHFPTGKASTKNAFVYWCKLFVYKILLQISTLRAKKILTVSEATKEEIVQHLHVQENKIIVSHNGVEEIFLKHAKTTSLFPFAYILYVGNAYPHKNINVLLQAFKDVIVEEKNIHLVLVGKKDYFYNNVLHTVKNMGIEKQVDFISDATDEKLVSLFRHAKALVLPSLMEGFGLSAVEAMATGCPVIASDIASIREVCGSSAFYFNPKSPTELTKILSGVLEKDKTFFDEKIKKAKEKAATFSWEKMAPDVLAVYESCTRLR